MKERPILMHARSVNGILEDRKLQTRRIIKPQPIAGLQGWDWGWPLPKRCTPGSADLWRNDCHSDRRISSFYSPYGAPGDRLWVRETFYCDVGPDCTLDERKAELYYRANVPSGKFQDAGYWGEPGSFWKPSIFMPRWACRLTLEVTGIRVERVQDITDTDIVSEGVSIPVSENGTVLQRLTGKHIPLQYLSKGGPHDESEQLHAEFAALWDDTNGPGAWDRNDWVWVVEFKRIENNKGEL